MFLKHKYLLIISFLLVCPFAVNQYAKASSVQAPRVQYNINSPRVNSLKIKQNNITERSIANANSISNGASNRNDIHLNNDLAVARVGGSKGRLRSFVNNHITPDNYNLHIQAGYLNRNKLNNAKLFTEFNIHKLEYNKQGQSLLHIPFRNAKLFNSISSTVRSTKYIVKNERFISFLRSSIPAFQSMKSFEEAADGTGQEADGNLSTALSGGLSLNDAYHSAIKAIHNTSTVQSVKHIRNKYADLWYLPWGQLGILHRYSAPKIKVPVSNDFIISGSLLKRASSGRLLAQFALSSLIQQGIRHSESITSILRGIYAVHNIRTHYAYFIGTNGFLHPKILDTLRHTLHITRRSRFPSYSRWLQLMTAYASKQRYHRQALRDTKKNLIRNLKNHERQGIRSKYSRKLRHHSRTSYHRIHKSVINDMHKTTHKQLISATYKQGKLDAENDLDSGRDQDSVNLILSHNMMSNPEYVIGFSHYLSDNGNSGSNGDALLNELTAYQQMSDNPEVRYGFEECMDYAGASAPGIVQEHDNDSDFHKGWYLATVYLNDGNISASNSEPFNQNI